MLILGIDPGKDGAVVAYDGATARGLRIKTILVDGAYSPWTLTSNLSFLLMGTRPDAAIIERQHAMPKQGSTSAYTIGMGEGLWLGILAAKGIAHDRVRAVDWQKAVARGDGVDPKAKGILACQRLLPGLDLLDGGRLRKPHTGLADAGCMAVYGWRLLAGKEVSPETI